MSSGIFGRAARVRVNFRDKIESCSHTNSMVPLTFVVLKPVPLLRPRASRRLRSSTAHAAKGQFACRGHVGTRKDYFRASSERVRVSCPPWCTKAQPRRGTILTFERLRRVRAGVGRPLRRVFTLTTFEWYMYGTANFLRGAPPRTPLGLCPRPRQGLAPLDPQNRLPWPSPSSPSAVTGVSPPRGRSSSTRHPSG